MKKSNSRKTLITITAAAAALTMMLSGCGSSASGSSASTASSKSDSGTFIAAGLFPLTGSMAYLGPANIATMKLAQKDINDAGGVLGKDIEITSADTSDADHADQNTSAAQSVLAKNPSVVVGPPSSSVVKNTYKQVTSAKVPMISSGATSTAFSGLNDYFFRTIPPDTVQGAVLGQIIAQDGVKNLAIAVFNDEYGTSLRDVVVKTVEDAGVKVVYGEKDTFDPTETNFSSMVTSIKASDADATLVIAFDQTVPLVKELAAQGVDTHKLYMTDGNTVDHSEDFESGLLEGSVGTIPGAHPTDEFQKNVKSFNSKAPIPPKPTTPSCWPRSPRRRAAPRTARPCRRTSWRSPAPPRARNAIPTRPAWPCSRMARRSSTRARPPSARSTTRMIRARPPSASTSTTPTTSRSSTIRRKVPCLRPDPRRRAWIVGADHGRTWQTARSGRQSSSGFAPFSYAGERMPPAGCLAERKTMHTPFAEPVRYYVQ